MMQGNPFNTARGAASSLQMSPPFAFNDVTMSVFPLRASLPRLESFCRNYLNQADDLVQFRPFMPFVYLVLLDYGRMSLEAANMGWVSQREVAFGIPLRWLNKHDGQLEFHDWAFTSPFIFVDNPMSMSTGREVYGWPKLLARLDPSVSEWIRDPHGPRKVFEVSTKRAAEAYAGQLREYRTFLTVMQHQTEGLLDVPANLDAITRPLSQISDAVAGIARLGKDLATTFAGMASDGITGSSVLPDFLDQDVVKAQLRPDRLREWTNASKWSPGLRDLLWALFPRVYANTINLKQFRDAGDPVAACYQAITAAKMPVRSVKQAGLLGAQNMLLGQLDGGYRIDMHHLAGLPVVDSLGLEVSEERETDGTMVSSLSPICPFWLQVDMSYGRADTVVQRGRGDDWRPGDLWTEAVRQRDELKRQRAEERHEKEKRKRERDEQAMRRDNDDPTTKGAKGQGSRSEGARTRGGAKQTAALSDIIDQVSQKLPGLERPGTLDLKAPSTQSATGADATTALDYLRAMNFFNTARGATEALGGGFSMPDASVRVLPLKADPAVLSKFVRSYLRVEDKMRFEAWGDYVYLVVSDFERMTSELNAISSARAREVKFAIPVKCYNWFEDGDYRGADTDARIGKGPLFEPARMLSSSDPDLQDRFLRGSDKMVTAGMVVPFAFVDDVSTAINDSEVTGVPTMSSAILSPDNDWLNIDFTSDHVKRQLVETRTQVLPALAAGAEAVEREVVDIHSHTPPTDDATESAHFNLNKWVDLLMTDLRNKRTEHGSLQLFPPDGLEHHRSDPFPDSVTQTEPLSMGRGFALKLLAGEFTFNQFSLKQFRDAKQTESACYQGLVMCRHSINNLHDLREYDRPIHVSIADYPTLPITKILGLKPKYMYPGDDRTISVLESVRPFAMRADLHKDEGVTLFERLDHSVWNMVDCPEQIFGVKHITDPDEIRALLDQRELVRDVPATIRYSYREDIDGPVEIVPKQDAELVLDDPEFEARALSNKVLEVHYEERSHFRDVHVLASGTMLDAFGKDEARDVAAFNRQIEERRKEDVFSARTAAGAMEFVSPGTIVDLILSDQWGLDESANRRQSNRLPHGIPVTTVSRKYRDILFPVPERQHGFWPLSESYHANQVRRRTSEVLQFIAEFWAVLDILIVSVDAESLFMQMSVEESVKPTIEPLPEPDDTDIPDDSVFVDEQPSLSLNLENQSTLDDFRGQSELGAMALGLIPAIFKQTAPVSNFEDYLTRSPYLLPTEAEWRDLRQAMDTINGYLKPKLPEELHTLIDEFFPIWAKFADRNIDKTAAIARGIAESMGSADIAEDFDMDHFYLSQPIETLQARLGKLVTKGLLPKDR